MNSEDGKIQPEHRTEDRRSNDLFSELLILPDGRVLVHNLTPAFATLLSGLNPDCEPIASRSINHAPPS